MVGVRGGGSRAVSIVLWYDGPQELRPLLPEYRLDLVTSPPGIRMWQNWWTSLLRLAYKKMVASVLASPSLSVSVPLSWITCFGGSQLLWCEAAWRAAPGWETKACQQLHEWAWKQSSKPASSPGSQPGSSGSPSWASADCSFSGRWASWLQPWEIAGAEPTAKPQPDSWPTVKLWRKQEIVSGVWSHYPGAVSSCSLSLCSHWGEPRPCWGKSPTHFHKWRAGSWNELKYFDFLSSSLSTTSDSLWLSFLLIDEKKLIWQSSGSAPLCPPPWAQVFLFWVVWT